MRMIKMKISDNSKCWRGCGTTNSSTFLYIVEVSIAVSPLENICPESIKSEPYDPEIPLLSIFPTEMHIIFTKDVYNNVHCYIFIITPN